MTNKICILLISTSFVVFSQCSLKLEGESCEATIDDQVETIGICKKDSTCPKAIGQQKYCRQKFNLICCPPELRVSEKSCLIDNKEWPPSLTEDMIVGGEKAELGEFPHMVSIGVYDSKDKYVNLCGGSLITNQYVLTAAHCLEEGLVVRIGIVNLFDPNLQEIAIEKIIPHPNYKKSETENTPIYNDIGLIKLSQSVIFSKNLRPACLWQNSDLFGNGTIVAIGYGYIGYRKPPSDDLLKVSLNVVDQISCNNSIFEFIEKATRSSQNKYKKMLPNGIISTQLCAGIKEGGKDTCNGDSGSPIHYERPKNRVTSAKYVIGLVGSGGKKCAEPDSPAIYTRVFPYLDWIESIVWATEDINNNTNEIKSVNFSSKNHSNIFMLIVILVIIQATYKFDKIFTPT